MKAFYDLGCTVGAYVVFPLPVQVDDEWRQSINQRRGMEARIRDRFDLTLKCIRRHYLGGDEPSKGYFVRYGGFFDLRGLPRNPLPEANFAEYQRCMIRWMGFISGRNERIAHFASSELHDWT